jgi:putative nucleotidyltransferase with HDIG domain
MGHKTVQSLVITASTETLYRSTNGGFKDKLLWEHALGVALTAKFLPQECHYASVEEAFLGGLLHDIGKVALDRNLGERYAAVVEPVSNEGRTFLKAEQEMLDFDHTEVSALMIEKEHVPRLGRGDTTTSPAHDVCGKPSGVCDCQPSQ